MSSSKYSKSRPEISIVVCHHVGTLIHGFLESVRKSVGVSYEIIVMTSDEHIALEGLRDCLVFHSTEPPAGKRNSGANVAQGEYLAFFDDDVEIADDTLYELKIGFSKDVWMVYGKLWNMEFRHRFDEAGSFLTPTGFLWSRAGQHEIDCGQYDKEEFVLSGKSASCMIKREYFNKIGGFDEDFGILGEETDLAWRVWLYGGKVLYEPLAVGWHAFNTKFKPIQKHYTSARVQFNGCRNYITMLIKNLGKENLCIIPIHMLIWFIAGLAMIGTGKVGQGWNILKGLVYVVRNLNGILEKRERIQNKRVKSDRELWPFIFCRPPNGYYRQRFLRYLRIGLHG